MYYTWFACLNVNFVFYLLLVELGKMRAQMICLRSFSLSVAVICGFFV